MELSTGGVAVIAALSSAILLALTAVLIFLIRRVREAEQRANLTEGCVRAISRLDFTYTEFLEAKTKPSDMERAFIRIIQVVKHLRRFVPDRLLMELNSEGENESDDSVVEEAEQPELLDSVRNFKPYENGSGSIPQGSARGSMTGIVPSTGDSINKIDEVRRGKRRSRRTNPLNSSSEKRESSTSASLPSMNSGDASLKESSTPNQSSRKISGNVSITTKRSLHHVRSSVTSEAAGEIARAAFQSFRSSKTNSLGAISGGSIPMIQQKPLEFKRIVILVAKFSLPNAVLDDTFHANTFFNSVAGRFGEVIKLRKGTIESFSHREIVAHWGSKASSMTTATNHACQVAHEMFSSWNSLIIDSLGSIDEAVFSKVNLSIAISCGRALLGVIVKDKFSSFILEGRALCRASLAADGDSQIEKCHRHCIIIDEQTKQVSEYDFFVRPSYISETSNPDQCVGETDTEWFQLYYELLEPKNTQKQDEWLYQIGGSVCTEDAFQKIFHRSVNNLNRLKNDPSADLINLRHVCSDCETLLKCYRDESEGAPSEEKIEKRSKYRALVELHKLLLKHLKQSEVRVPAQAYVQIQPDPI